MPPTHRTPLRRTSHSSLFGLSRSTQLPESNSSLEFIETAMEEFVEEATRLRANYEGIAQLDETLHTFNDAFASWLYVMDMNALTTDWPQAPTDISFKLARQRADENAIAAAAKTAAEAKANAEREAQAEPERTITAETTQADVTYNTSASKPTTVAKKKVMKAKPSAKEKRERNLEIERIISALPLEFRGNEPTLRKNMESVIEGLLNAPNMTAKIADLVTPECNQARVNKCLIALVNRKVVQKESSTVFLDVPEIHAPLRGAPCAIVAQSLGEYCQERLQLVDSFSAH